MAFIFAVFLSTIMLIFSFPLEGAVVGTTLFILFQYLKSPKYISRITYGLSLSPKQEAQMIMEKKQKYDLDGWRS